MGAETRAVRRVGINHIAITYADRDQFLQHLAHLKANEIPFLVRGDHGMTHSVYIADPDGNGIEVLYEMPAEVCWGWFGRPTGAGFLPVCRWLRPLTGHQ